MSPFQAINVLCTSPFQAINVLCTMSGCKFIKKDRKKFGGGIALRILQTLRF